MEDLQKKHRQEQKDLQSRITQKKKNASKKTRKGINEECAEMERQLKESQASEIRILNGEDKDPDDSHLSNANGATMILQSNGDHLPQSFDDSLQSLSLSSTSQDKGHAKKPNRQKARLARRAAEQEAAVHQAEKEATDLPDLRQQEKERMNEAYASKGLTEHEIRSDGHCLYAAIADQLVHCGKGLALKDDSRKPQDGESAPLIGYKTTREVAASYISQHADDFSPFLEEPLETYVRTIRETGEWGGHLEIQALAKAYGVDIHVLQANGRVELISGNSKEPTAELWLAYYHHNYGLGEHYNSLRAPDA